jgi:starch phosphorylase
VEAYKNIARPPCDEAAILSGSCERPAATRGKYNPHWRYENESKSRAVLDLIFTDHFSATNPVFSPHCVTRGTLGG